MSDVHAKTLCTRLIEQENNFRHERVFNNLTVTVKILILNKGKRRKFKFNCAMLPRCRGSNDEV